MTGDGKDARGTGHRSVAHTADLRVEAWGRSKADCLAEAVRAVVESFADLRTASDTGIREVALPVADADDQLVALLDEVIYLMDARGEVPREVSVDEESDGLTARLWMVDSRTVTTVGAVPKAVALHDLAVVRTGRTWRCSVTVDV